MLLGAARGTPKAEGKVALVTGAFGEVGKEIALAFRQQGWKVFLAGKDARGVEKLVADLRAEGGVSEGVMLGREDRDDVARIFVEVRRRFGRLDVLVNVVGKSCGSRSVEDVTEEEWDEVTGSTMKSVFLFSQAGMSIMRRLGSGSIINVSLHTGRIHPLLTGSHDAAARSGIIGFTRRLGKELSGARIQVRAVGLSMIYGTPSGATLWDLYREDELDKYLEDIPAGRLVTNREAATAVVSLASGVQGRFDAAVATYGSGWGI